MNKIKYFIQQSWLLIVASFCFGLLIAATNSLLSQRIEQNQQDKLYSLMRQLITTADDFEKIELDERTTVFKALGSDKGVSGFAFIAKGAGFADKIKLVIAVDGNCEKLFGFKVLASNETPGFGNRISEDFFAGQFTGAPAGVFKLVKSGNAEEIDSRIVAISGATVSSEAVVKILNAYTDKVKKQLQAEGLIGNGS